MLDDDLEEGEISSDGDKDEVLRSYSHTTDHINNNIINFYKRWLLSVAVG